MLERILRETTRQTGQQTVAVVMAAPLLYLLITVKVVAFEKVSFSDTQIPKGVCSQIDSR